MTYPHLRPVEPHRAVDLSALPQGRYWSLSHDGEVGYWTQLDQEPDATGPYGCAQHAVDELAERAGRAMAVWDPGARGEDGSPAVSDARQALQAALRLAFAMLVAWAIAWAVLS